MANTIQIFDKFSSKNLHRPCEFKFYKPKEKVLIVNSNTHKFKHEIVLYTSVASPTIKLKKSDNTIQSLITKFTMVNLSRRWISRLSGIAAT